MSKVLISFPAQGYVVDADVALKLLDTMKNYEVYKKKYGEGNDYTHHIYSPSLRDIVYGDITIKPLPDDSYQLAKLAGDPEDQDTP